MNFGKRNSRGLITASMTAAIFFAVILFLGIPAVRSQIVRNSEGAEPRQAVSASKTPHPKVLDQGIDIAARKLAISYNIPVPQAIIPVYKTSGKEFYLMFLSVIGTESSDDPSLRRIYISARSSIHGKVSLANGAWEESFVTNAKGLVAIDLPDWAEMTSFETEVILPKVFKIEAEDEIAVYGFSHKWLSSDGFLVLPVEALGTNYTIASIRNALSYFGGQVDTYILNSINPRSEFGIAAIADNTTVTVTLSADSYNGKFKRGIPYSFTMNKGEAIQIMARDTAQIGMFSGFQSWVGPLANGIDCDLTGSLVTSDKPIAVFSGHERAAVPDSLEYVYDNHPSVSRDHLIEQMPPQESWGKHFAVVASSQDDYNMRPKSGDIIRVISGFDSTVVTVNGKLQSKINKGSYAQFPVTSIAYIETSQPSLVVKYLRTALPDSSAPGDPDLTVVPPLENLSTFYSLPTVAVGFDFIDHYITILADSLALGSTTLNGRVLDPHVFKPVPGSRYYWVTQRTYAGSQRVESPLPCYAETYGYGPFDSYSFSGGGSFKYLHDLVAQDLDFGKIRAGSSKDSLTGVQSVSIPMPLGDSVTIYGYSWVSGDTNTFDLLDTITSPISIPPGDILHVNFVFHPLTVGSFQAKLRVWSSNTDDVYITVYGKSSKPIIDVEPPVINFGRVRVGKIHDSIFTIYSKGDTLVLQNTNRYKLDLLGTYFSATALSGSNVMPGGSIRTDSVFFAPLKREYDSVMISVKNSTDSMPLIPVWLYGRGVNFDIHTQGNFFGKIRLGTPSPSATIPVANNGDDTTSIVSISLMPNVGRPRDFILDVTTLPSNATLDWRLDTLGSIKHIHSFNVNFSPVFDQVNNIIDTGFDTAIVEIVTTDGNIYYDTLSGIGAEPWLIATIPVLDFGTITDPLVTTATLYDTLVNKGTMTGILQSLVFLNGSHFSLHSLVAPNTPVAENGLIPFAVDFMVNSIGDFYDTVYANNDSRNRPLVILKAKVRAGIAPIEPIMLGDISTCLPVDTTIIINNPYPVNITLSSFRFEGDTAGFEFVDTNKLNLPVHIAAGSIFSLHIRYRFPADSLNGSQTVKVIIARPSGGDDLSLNYDTVLVTLNRKTVLLNLSAVMPPYSPSAGDQPFRLPIHLNGNRFGKPELDNDTLRLVFSNKLIRPIGVDHTGSLSESTPTNGIPQQPPPVWDEATSTYSIPCVGLHLSSDVSSNTLLMTLLCTAYLTKDTSITITPFVGYTTQPCAYRVSKDSTLLSYANECGDQTIRALMLTSSIPIHINSPVPDPAMLSGSQTVTCSYFAAKDLMLSWKLYDPVGVMVAQAEEVPIRGGDGSFGISLKQIRTSGAHYLEVTVRDAESGAHMMISSKFTVIK